MKSFLSSILTVTALAVSVAGCSSDGGMLGSSLTTSSVDPAKAAAAAKLDPACIALTAKIDGLRKDGVTERVEKASAGKTTNVSVKRESLAKMAELDKANSDYQTKCSAPGLAKPAPAAAAVVPAANTTPAAKVSNAAPAPAAKKAVAAKTTATLAAPAVIADPAAVAAPAVQAAAATTITTIAPQAPAAVVVPAAAVAVAAPAAQVPAGSP